MSSRGPWGSSVYYYDGLSKEVTTWTDDAAGNRASASDQSGSWTYDNLNRMSASPNHTYSNNILGNTTEINGFDLEWDLLNRLTLMKDGSNESIWQIYKYRADGMRVSQVDDYQNTTKRFRYDGQMPVETAAFNGTSSLTWTSTARNVLGARGVDALETETSGGTVSTYPLYDTHGNVKAYVKKEASNTWSSLGWKQYNVWGGVRSSSGGAGTTSAYCGNLGHVSDHETGLIYMRARYYAPWAGRFISEDPAREGLHWFAYCLNNPIAGVDLSGKAMNPVAAGGSIAVAFYFLYCFYGGDDQSVPTALRHFVAALAAVGVTATSAAIEPWVLRAGEKIAALLRLDRKNDPYSTAAKLSRNDGRIAFYTGYAIALIFIMEELEAWAAGETE